MEALVVQPWLLAVLARLEVPGVQWHLEIETQAFLWNLSEHMDSSLQDAKVFNIDVENGGLVSDVYGDNRQVRWPSKELEA